MTPHSVDTRDYKRPWAYPDLTPVLTADGKDRNGNLRANHSERQAYEGVDEDHWQRDSPAPVIPGPFPKGSTPDEVFFRTTVPTDAAVRSAYEQSQSPAGDRPPQHRQHSAGSHRGKPARRSDSIHRLPYRKSP